MTTEEAVSLVRPALESVPPVWADLGAGSGVFTEALASLLGSRGEVVAVERDPDALVALRQRAARLPPGHAPVTVVEADLRDLDSLTGLPPAFGGILLANVLHFFPEPAALVTAAQRRLATGGRLVVLEYERDTANPWVPHPLPLERLDRLAERLGLAAPRVVARRPSRFGATLYCAVLEPSGFPA